MAPAAGLSRRSRIKRVIQNIGNRPETIFGEIMQFGFRNGLDNGISPDTFKPLGIFQRAFQAGACFKQRAMPRRCSRIVLSQFDTCRSG